MLTFLKAVMDTVFKIQCLYRLLRQAFDGSGYVSEEARLPSSSSEWSGFLSTYEASLDFDHMFFPLVALSSLVRNANKSVNIPSIVAYYFVTAGVWIVTAGPSLTVTSTSLCYFLRHLIVSIRHGGYRTLKTYCLKLSSYLNQEKHRQFPLLTSILWVFISL